jgi:hypothetical protein
MKSGRTKLRIYLAELIIGCLIILISGNNVKGQNISTIDFKPIAQNVNGNKINNYTTSKKFDVNLKTEHRSEYVDMTFLEEVKEEKIKIEDWMLNSDHTFWTPAKEEIEDDIELEDWMLDLSHW